VVVFYETLQKGASTRIGLSIRKMRIYTAPHPDVLEPQGMENIIQASRSGCYHHRLPLLHSRADPERGGDWPLALAQL
jgi:hypothetical protein